MKKVRYDYDQYDKRVDTMQGDICIASLKVEENDFEAHEEMSEDDKDLHYDEMIKEAKRFEQCKRDSAYDDEHNNRRF